MTLTTLDPPAAAVVSMWTQQCYGDQIAAALQLLEDECDQLAAYLVTESVPLPAPLELGSRTTGLANVALLRRPAELDQASWLQRWQHDHTPVAIETQSTFGYTQNAVVRALTPDAPAAGRHRRRAVPGRGDHRSEGVLRRGRRRRPAAAIVPNGRQHIGIRRQREHRHRADQSLCAENTLPQLRRHP